MKKLTADDRINLEIEDAELNKIGEREYYELEEERAKLTIIEQYTNDIWNQDDINRYDDLQDERDNDDEYDEREREAQQAEYERDAEQEAIDEQCDSEAQQAEDELTER
jgi:hypothetical protein